jgi:GNAT superfamily N-acetyltransferase
MKTFLTRDLRSDDKAQWLPLWQGYLEFYKTRFDADQADLTFARLLDPSEPMFALAAEREARLIGVVHCVLHRSTGTRADYCYLQDLFTSPDARRQGVGGALIEAVYARADALGLARVYWLTHESNAPGRALYDKVARNYGFIQYRR